MSRSAASRSGDGSAISFGGASTGLVGGFTDFGFGYYAWPPSTTPFDVYYDDIVLGTERVGCLPLPAP